MPVDKSAAENPALTPFGRTPDGRVVHRAQLTAGELSLSVLDLGATVQRLDLTAPDGVRRNIVLGYDDPRSYLAATDYFGATVGRYANRIAGGRCRIGDRSVQLGVHDRGNHLHGGPDGFSARMWDWVEVGPTRAVLRLHSPDGDQGFPGAVTAQVAYSVSALGVRIELSATTDRTTVVNLTNHSYFNLDGEGSIDWHDLAVAADHYTPVDATGIPLGGHVEVAGTAFDLRESTRVGECIRRPDPQLLAARGLDHNFVLTGSGFRPVARLSSARSGWRLQVSTDQPGLQVYSGNFLTGEWVGSHGQALRQGAGLALEPQLFPDSPNRPDFPSATLQPGAEYRSVIEWEFSHD